MLHALWLPDSMNTGVNSLQLRNPLSRLCLPCQVLLRLAQNLGTIRASEAHFLALNLALVLGAILRISKDQGLDVAASVGRRVGFEVVYLTTVVGAAALELVHKIVSGLFRTSGCPRHENLPDSCNQRIHPERG